MLSANTDALGPSFFFMRRPLVLFVVVGVGEVWVIRVGTGVGVGFVDTMVSIACFDVAVVLCVDVDPVTHRPSNCSGSFVLLLPV